MSRRVTRYNNRIGPDLSSGMMVLTIFLAAVVILCVYFACNAVPLRVHSPADTDAGAGTYAEAEPETAPPPLIPDELTDVIDVPDSDSTRGYLILVNSEYAYTFGGEDIISLYRNEDKSSSYGLAVANISCDRSILVYLNEMIDAYVEATEDNGVIINSGYRTYDEQNDILQARIERDGEEEAYRYVSLPGHSEHHTGLGVDIASIGANYDGQWFPKNCSQFGFVQRYRADKVDITGIASEYWHYRYVGAPHSEIMAAENLCLEEYIEMIRGHSYADPYEFTSSEGTEYIVYYTSCGGVGQTEIKVPRGTEYTVSGDNAGGFITAVTMKRGEE